MYKTYKHFLELVLLTSLIFVHNSFAQVSTNTQNFAVLTAKAEQYLQMKYGNNPDTLIKVQTPEDSQEVAECPTIDFSVPGNRPSNGNIRVRAQCSKPQAWTLYLSANIVQKKIYYMSKVRLEPGRIISEADLQIAKDFPENLPFGVVSDPQLIVGKSVINTIEVGTPMIGPSLKNENVINFGQNVKIIVGGPGFKINAEGKAMNSAALGQNVQVKMASGQLINGIARSGGQVEVMK
jgi:flagella basal body P-ring formation protein FlgA